MKSFTEFGPHAEWIRTLDCIQCRRRGPSESHHALRRRDGGKAHHQVPLCTRCHRAVHAQGDAGRTGKIDLVALAATLWHTRPQWVRDKENATAFPY